jgi:hypothetical protein
MNMTWNITHMRKYLQADSFIKSKMIQTDAYLNVFQAEM